MTYRWMALVGAVLLVAGSARAQDASSEPLGPPVVPSPLAEADASPSPMPFFTPGSTPAAALDRRFWTTGEFMFAWMRGTNLPSLVTTSPPGTPRAEAGVPGAPGTSVIFGGYVDDRVRPGFRLGAGYWFDADQTLGMEAGFMLIGSQATSFSATSTDGTILARPYFDPTLSSHQAVLVAYPGSSNGSISITAKSGYLYETHVDFTEKAIDVGWFRAYALIGYRYFRYDERLTAQQTILPVNPAFVPGTSVVSNDSFYTKNEFHGADLGYRWYFFHDNWSLEILGKVAVGRMNRFVQVGGDQTINVPGAASIVQPAGVLALSSNSGVIHFTDWRAIPEFGLTFNWQITSSLSARVGYTFMYFNSLARAADQVDTVINPNNFPNSGATGGPNHPALNLQRSDLWLQSINLGLQWTY